LEAFPLPKKFTGMALGVIIAIITSRSLLRVSLKLWKVRGNLVFAKVQGGMSCRFFFIQFIILGYVSGEVLRKEVELKALVHMDTEPHIDEPPGSPQVADGLA